MVPWAAAAAGSSSSCGAQPALASRGSRCPAAASNQHSASIGWRCTLFVARAARAGSGIAGPVAAAARRVVGGSTRSAPIAGRQCHLDAAAGWQWQAVASAFATAWSAAPIAEICCGLQGPAPGATGCFGTAISPQRLRAADTVDRFEFGSAPSSTQSHARAEAGARVAPGGPHVSSMLAASFLGPFPCSS